MQKVKLKQSNDRKHFLIIRWSGKLFSGTQNCGYHTDEGKWVKK